MIQSSDRGLALTSIDDYWRFAQYVASSGLAPKGITKPEAILIAIQYGAELGLAPMRALNSIAVINGRPSIWGDAMLAVCQRSSVCEYVREWTEGEGESLVAYCEAKRRGWTQPVKRSFSYLEAKRAGLLGKDTYKQFPARMCGMRARAFCLRDAFADLLCGMLSAEEAQDIPPEQVFVSGDVQPPSDLDELADVIEGVKERPEPQEDPDPLATDAEWEPNEGPKGERLFDDDYQAYE